MRRVQSPRSYAARRLDPLSVEHRGDLKLTAEGFDIPLQSVVSSRLQGTGSVSADSRAG